MVKIAAVTLAAVGVIAPFAAAANCKTGLNYCGYNLLNIGRRLNISLNQSYVRS
jgi:hypothetical protein